MQIADALAHVPLACALRVSRKRRAKNRARCLRARHVHIVDRRRNLPLKRGNRGNGADEVVVEAGINAERVDFLHEEERFEGEIVVEAEEIAEGREQENPAVLPGGGDAVFAAPAKIGGSIFGMSIEFEDLKRMSEEGEEGPTFLSKEVLSTIIQPSLVKHAM